MKKLNLTATATAFTLLTSPYALATIELTDDLSFSGFGSTSVTTTDNKTPLYLNHEITDEVCYDCDTTLGLQLDYLFLDNFSASIQLMKRPQDEWSEPQLEWAYVGYNYEQFDIKAGRLRLPLFLDSEFYYVNHAYTAARPNAEVYDAVLGITSYDGVGVTWNAELTDDLSLAVNPYGAMSGKPKAEKGNTKYEFPINYSAGLAIDLASFDYKVHFNVFHANFDMKIESYGFPTFEQKDINVTLYSLGGEYTWDALTLRAESYYSENTFNWYTQAAYTIGIFTPYLSYGEMHNSSVTEGPGKRGSNRNNTVTTGLRFDITPSVSLNAEYQHTEVNNNYPFGTNGQFTTPFGMNPQLDANVYTLMLNFII